MVKLVAALFCTGCFLLTVAGNDDFDLSDALPDTVTKKPPPTTKRPSVGDNPRPKPYPDLGPQSGGQGNNGDNSRPKLYPDLRPHSGGHGNDDPDLHLGDALGGGDGHLNPQPNPRPRPRPQPGSHGYSDNFSDLDLNDGKPLPPRSPGENEHISDQGGNIVDSSSTAQITSPVVTVVVLLAVGAVAGYTAYKKKRYCFKPRDGAVV
ncbi:glycoprotein Xg-like [Rhineura floridana]|uniref:glycoprotein Xg-like n=1 Tax=Rhineura floridana TaxID=261503 RepID=UPI002AC8707C|nr:glycoprotein Xg-like [Rhineura floridana]